LRANWLFKDSNPRQKNGRPEWRKNNTLLFANIDKSGFVTNIKPLQIFPNTFDCEMNPDWIDGGHGLQDPRIISQNNKLKILFNARNQNSQKFEECTGEIKRGIWSAELDLFSKVLSKRPRKIAEKGLGKWDVERNWTPVDDELADEGIFVYSLFPDLIVVNTTDPGLQIKKFSTLNSFEKIFKSVSEISGKTLESAKTQVSLHGSSPILRLKENTFLGILHCHFTPENEGSRIYLNFFYKITISSNFQNFEITSSGHAPLPLTYEIDDKFAILNRQKKQFRNNYPSKNRIAFVSDMTRVHDEFWITYGAGDAESRLFILPIQNLPKFID